MAEGLVLWMEALQVYWTAPITLTILLVLGASMGTLIYVFLANARNTRWRVTVLTGLYAMSIFFWLFVAVSLVMCISQARMVAYRTWGVPVAAAIAVLSALGASVAISLVIWKRAPARVIRKFRPRPAGPEEAWSQQYVELLASLEGTLAPKIGIIAGQAPLAFAVGGRDPMVLVSRPLLERLDREETEAVLAHEFMHLKHRDAEFKVFSSVFSRILFFDPFSKFFDPALHREREYLADETAARSTGKPAVLASALLKISSVGPSAPPAAPGLSILGPDKGIFSRYPPLRERVQRLLVLSELLSPRAAPNAGDPSLRNSL